MMTTTELTPLQQLRSISKQGFRSEFLSEVCKRRQYEELGDVSDDEGNAYDDAIEVLSKLQAFIDTSLVEIKELKAHFHQWSEDEYCVVCGADGRA